MHPKDISISDYTYYLPEEKIASHPLSERDASKLLIYKEGKIVEDIYKNLAEYIPSNSLLVLNSSKVIEARLLFQKPSGGLIEIFCLEPHEQYGGIHTAMLQQQKVLWKCMIGGASKWKQGQVLEKKIVIADKEMVVHAAYIEKRSDCFVIELSWFPSEFSFAEVLHDAGAIPLPPYIKRAAEASDTERYQTIYAREDGSVAAPTAGLHFTNTVFESLAKKNIQRDFVTLHVGAGTFKPVKAPLMKDHEMHAEFMEVRKETIERVIAHLDENIIAVGTTSLRTLESLYWLGVKKKMESRKPACRQAWSKIENDVQLEEIFQWEVYDILQQRMSPEEALNALLDWMSENDLNTLFAKTQIIIAPGYRLRVAKALLTNFHQPQSTLLLLVAAVAGNDWRKIYDHALENDFRFLSYGDGSLLWVSGDR